MFWIYLVRVFLQLACRIPQPCFYQLHKIVISSLCVKPMCIINFHEIWLWSVVASSCLHINNTGEVLTSHIHCFHDLYVHQCATMIDQCNTMLVLCVSTLQVDTGQFTSSYCRHEALESTCTWCRQALDYCVQSAVLV